MALAKHMLLLLAACLAGCAVTSTAPDGSRTIVGFVYLTLPPSTPTPSPDRADGLRAVSLGLALTQADSGSVMTLGYSDTTLLSARGSSCVAFDFR